METATGLGGPPEGRQSSGPSAQVLPAKASILSNGERRTLRSSCRLVSLERAEPPEGSRRPGRISSVSTWNVEGYAFFHGSLSTVVPEP